MNVSDISELNDILKLLTPSAIEIKGSVELHPCDLLHPAHVTTPAASTSVWPRSDGGNHLHTMCFILIRIKARRNQFLAAATSNQQPKFYQLPFKRENSALPPHKQKKNSILCARRDRGEQLSHSLPSKSKSCTRSFLSHLREKSKAFRKATNCTFIFYLQNVILHRGLVQEISPAAVYIGECFGTYKKAARTSKNRTNSNSFGV